VFLAQGYAADQGRGGSFDCLLMVVDATNHPHLVGPNEDPSLRPQQGTTFVGSVSGRIPL
jgi:hypothetical protein